MLRETQLFLLVGALVTFGACSSDSSPRQHRSSATTTTTTTLAAVTSTTVTGYATPENAIARYVQDHGNQYVGDCASANTATDAGKWCSLLRDDRGETRVYGIGPVASEIVTVLTLHRGADGHWTVTMADPAPAPA